MKKLVIWSFLCGSLIACNQEVKEENARLKQENQALTASQSAQDSTLEEFVQSFQTIQSNLDSIRTREKAIRAARSSGVESAPDLRSRILEDIEAINQLIGQNRQTIDKLSAQLQDRDSRIRGMNQLIATLKSQIDQKDAQIDSLKNDLASLNFKMEQLNQKVGTLTEQKMAQNKVIDEQEQALNTAYYTLGSEEELIENKVIVEEGGFLGLGKTATLADDLNRSYFTQIDLRKTSEIPLNLATTEVEMISAHPEGSYEWIQTEEQTEKLRITDPAQFWGNSKFLVILIDQ